MNRKTKRSIKAIQAMSHNEQLVAIQAMNIEGVSADVTMDSLMFPSVVSGMGGITNTYRTYDSQVTETYKKYSGDSDFGNEPTRIMVDGRTAFIAGEGLNLNLGNTVGKGHKEFFKYFIVLNKLNSIRLFDLVRYTEMAGYAIISILKTGDKLKKIPVFGLQPNNMGKNYYAPTLRNPLNPYDIANVYLVKDGEKVKVDIKNMIYVRTGGTGEFTCSPTTKIGLLLTDAENYDRGVKDLRQLNYKCARITPSFNTTSKSETTALQTWLQKTKWKIGQAFAGTAKLSYEVPGTGAHQNLLTEITANLKTMSGLSGIPTHWFGYVDLVSNKATAAEMYASVNNATVMERECIQDALKEAFMTAQQVYIDAGGSLIKEITDDFEIRLPLIDFGRFESNVKAYDQMYNNGIVSKQTYRSIVPGIDPVFEEEQIDKEQGEQAEKDKEEAKKIVTKSIIEPDEDIEIEEEE